MALRSTKITSEIITSCNRLFASSTKLPVSSTLSFEPTQESIRYKISNTEKPQDLPEITFKKDVTIFEELQPCSQMEYQVFGKQAKWTEVAESPFPDQLKNSFLPSVKVSDLQKAEEKILKAKSMNFAPIRRSFSMVSDVRHSKKTEHTDCEPKCIPKIKPCGANKKKTECKMQSDCPKHRLGNCKQSKGSNCKLNYLDPECTKTFAPYPSYSELCAEDLPEDPSECTQCPWRSCNEADSIKLQPKKRKYSTSASHMAATTGVVVGPLTKPPCKPPPSPCEVRREIEKRQRKEKSETDSKKKKKGQEDDLHQVPILDRQVVQNESIYMNSVYNPQSSLTGSNSMDLPETTWSYLERESGTMEAASDRKGNPKDQPPNCKVNIKPSKEQKPSKSTILEYGGPEWWVGRTKRKIIEVEEKEKMALSETMQMQQKDKKPIKGDEGHPPPCPPPKPTPGFNVPCPKVPLKKPKYKKRPLRQAYYEEAKKDRENK